ncbi:hypothetical protein ACJX0J_034870, partial [Zea mays]
IEDLVASIQSNNMEVESTDVFVRMPGNDFGEIHFFHINVYQSKIDTRVLLHLYMSTEYQKPSSSEHHQFNH